MTGGATRQEYQEKLERLVGLLESNCAQLGLFGEVFLREFRQAGTSIELSDEFPTNTFGSAAYNRKKNKIFFYEDVFDDDMEAQRILFHECIHAIQARKAALNHFGATIVDGNGGRHCMSPAALVFKYYLAEVDAYAKQHTFEYLLKSADKARISDEDYLIDIVNDYARRLTHYSDDPKPDRNIDSHIDNLLDNMREFNLKSAKGARFYSMGAEDVFEQGSSLGLNSFYNTAGDYVLKEFLLNEEQANKLADINSEYSVPAYEEQMLFDDFLAEMGVDRREFLRLMLIDLPSVNDSSPSPGQTKHPLPSM